MSTPAHPMAAHRVGRILGATAAVLAVLSPVARGDDLYFSASAYAVGAGGSEFVHEVEVLNPAGTPASFLLAWLPQGQDNSNPVTVELTVDPERATRYGNILSTAFGLGPVSVGALRVRPAGDGLVFHSRILNVSGGDTIGQVIPATPEASGFGEAEQSVILGLGEDGDVRSNVWCLNTTVIPISVSVQLYRTDGVLLSNLSVALPPLSSQQMNRVFASSAPVEGFVRLSTSTPGGRAICAGAVVGNLSNDPSTEPGTNLADAASEVYLPYAVESATESSTVDVFAPGGDVLVTIELLPTGMDNTNPASYDLLVPGGQVARMDHVLANLFGHQGTAALRLSGAGSILMASSRTLSASPTGPVSRWVPPVPTSEEFVRAEVVSLIHLQESADFQTDIGLVNTSPSAMDVAITLYGEAGNLLGSIPVQLLPFGHAQLDSVFTTVGHPSVPVGFATVVTTTPGGSFVAYATVTDLDTRDASHVTGRRIRQSVFIDGFESGDTSAWSAAVPRVRPPCEDSPSCAGIDKDPP